MRLIDADALITKLNNTYEMNYGEILINPSDFIEIVEDAPTVESYISNLELIAEEEVENIKLGDLIGMLQQCYKDKRDVDVEFVSTINYMSDGFDLQFNDITYLDETIMIGLDLTINTDGLKQEIENLANEKPENRIKY